MSRMTARERLARGSRLNQGLTLIAIVMVAIATLATVRSGMALRASVADLQAAEASIAKTQSMLATFGKTESFGLRWLLSLRGDYLLRYRADMQRLDAELAELRLTASDPSSQAIIGRLQSLARERWRFNDQTIAVAVTEGTEATIERIRSGGGVEFGDGIRALAEALEAGKRAERDALQARVQRERTQAAATVLATSAMAAALALAAFAATRRERRLIRAAANAELAQTRAEEASRQKSLFLANMSHEIRTPMNAIFGFSQLLARRVSDPQLQEYVAIIRTSGDSLLALINDILDLSRIEAGKMELALEPTDIADLVQSTAAVFLQPAEDAGLSLVVDIQPALPMLRVDAHRLRQVVGNLLGNAVKYSHEGQISLRCGGQSVAPGEHALWLEVEDQGPGIGELSQERLFEPFLRDPSAERSGTPGSGLGLSIVKRLIDLMGGTVQLLRSDACGSCFRIDLPQLTEADDAYVAAQAAALPDFSAFAGRRVLVADDVAWNRRLIAAYLVGAGIELDEAEDGAQAVAALDENPPDLVLMDLRMPVMDGHAACAAMRQRKGAALPIIALSASGPELGNDGVGARFDAYLSKPVAAAALHACLLQWLPAGPRSSEHAPAAPGAAAAGVPALDAAGARALRLRIVDASQTLRLSELRALALDLESAAGAGPVPALAHSSKRLVQCVAQFDLSGCERELAVLDRLLADAADGRSG